MELIDREALMEHLNAMRYTARDESDIPRQVRMVVAAIENAPTVDAVPVVRCKDCKHWGKHDVPVAGETDKVKACEWASWMVGANGYCVYGERKGGDE